METEARVVASYGALRKFCHNKGKAVAEAEEEELPDMTEFIEGLESSEDAFVVFNTEEECDESLKRYEGRDEALKRYEETGGLECEDAQLQLDAVTCEPEDQV